KGSRMTYRLGDVVFTREMMLVQKKEQMLIKVTLEKANSVVTMRMHPFLAFRNIHKLSKANLYVNRQYEEAPNGIKSCMYEGYPDLYMQLSKKAEFVAVPDWYYNIEYLEEQRRGYDYKEDLYVPGYFELTLKKGESVVFSAATHEAKTMGLKRLFQRESDLRIPLDSFWNCLHNSAQQFVVRSRTKTQILSGFPWCGVSSRHTFISLPGLTLSTGETKSAFDVINTMVKTMRNGLFPNAYRQGHAYYNSADAPLWFIWSLQQLQKYSGEDVWNLYRKPVMQIMEAYITGTEFGIAMHDNGLIFGGEDQIPVTWMDASPGGNPVTLRKGYAVEVNALWYNAVCQVLSWSDRNSAFCQKWGTLPAVIEESFVNEFWISDKGYMADYVDNGYKDIAVRPNMVIATSLEFSPVNKEMKKSILDVVKSELLTPKGLRSLSPKNPMYRETYEGDQEKRDRAAHQGTVHPWFLEHFVRGYLDVHKRSGLNLIKELYDGFERDMTEYGIGTISEMYDGNLPHDPRGATSFASSVASVLRTGEIIDNYKR
ncbi:MAG TPA: amylo-alpha-1,6-glucosidase, partial [Bacteroidales bacterium]|nr:amylo-alpha-1,6-glucosidase [Bacteroidales bacterium]